MLRKCKKRAGKKEKGASSGREVGVTNRGVFSAYESSQRDQCSHGQRGADVETEVKDIIFKRWR